MMLKKDKEKGERLNAAAANAKSAKSNDILLIALLNELVHFK